MINFDKEELLNIAKLSGLKLDNNEITLFAQHIPKILDYVEQLQKVNMTDEVEYITYKESIKHKERFDQDVLAHIISNKVAFKLKMRNKHFNDNYDPFLIPEKYLNKSVDGWVETEYMFSRGRDSGRYFAKEGMSLQEFPREIRHSIANKYYDDIDMVNAHPTILSHICNLYNINCKYLNKYLTHREKTIRP